MRNEIKKLLLVGLLRANGTPMPQAAMIGLGVTHRSSPSKGEVESIIKELEDTDFISGADDEFNVRSWTLTVKGKHTAQKS